jgi:hypothetical protein
MQRSTVLLILGAALMWSTIAAHSGAKKYLFLVCDAKPNIIASYGDFPRALCIAVLKGLSKEYGRPVKTANITQLRAAAAKTGSNSNTDWIVLQLLTANAHTASAQLLNGSAQKLSFGQRQSKNVISTRMIDAVLNQAAVNNFAAALIKNLTEK